MVSAIIFAVQQGAPQNDGGLSYGSVPLWLAIFFNVVLTVGLHINTVRRARVQAKADFQLEEFSTQIRAPINNQLDDLAEISNEVVSWSLAGAEAEFQKFVRDVQENRIPQWVRRMSRYANEVDRRHFIREVSLTEKLQDWEDQLIASVDGLSTYLNVGTDRPRAIKEFEQEARKCESDFRDRLYKIAENIHLTKER